MITQKNQLILASKILLVDDEMVNLLVVNSHLKDAGFNDVTSISDPTEAVKLYKKVPFDLVLLDINMPALSGFDVMKKFKDINKKIAPPVIILTGQIDKKTRIKALECGARDFVVKPFDSDEIINRVKNLIEMHQSQKMLDSYNQDLESQIAERTKDLLDTQLEIVRRLGYAAEYRDTDTAEHTLRVGEYSRILGEEMGIKGEALRNLHYTAPMHDIGKIGIPDHILLKPGKFNDDERKQMEKHSEIGAKILRGQNSQLLIDAREIALTHHERWDGTGYPSGLAGEDIPINGRIVIIADVFDALTMERPYKKPWPIEDAIEYIRDNSGKMFDPNIIKAFDKRLDEILTISKTIK